MSSKLKPLSLLEGLQGRTRRNTGFILLVLLLVSCIGLLASALKFDDRLVAVRAADSDNQGWLVAQLEVDYQAFIIALGAATQNADLESGANLVELHNDAVLRFDIFYSRTSVLTASLADELLPTRLETMLQSLVAVRNELAQRIDAIEAGDVEAMRALAAEVGLHEPLVRDVSTMAMQQFIDIAQDARLAEKSLWQRFLLESLILLSMTSIAAFLAVRLWLDLERRTLQAERAALTVSKAYEASLSAVIVTDLEGRILLCNRAAERIFGRSTDELVGSLVETTIVPRTLLRVYRRALERTRKLDPTKLLGSSPYPSEGRRANGEIFPIELSHALDMDLEGDPILISFVRDISDQVAAENKLRSAVEEAQKYAAARGMFLATMSHEMRTPLHGLIASLELIDKSHLDEANLKLLSTARDCSERALTQINDVLNLTRLNENKERKNAFSTAKVARDVVNEMQSIARERGNVLNVTIQDPACEQQVVGYPSAFSRVLYNLVGNAVKFTEDGSISVEIGSRKQGNDALEITVSVTDEGPGIPKEDHERIFEMFETSPSAQNIGDAGTGLGLPIAKLAVERMGGELSLTSALGQGSHFEFTILVEQESEHVLQISESDAKAFDTARSNLPLATGVPREILIVDDNEVNLTVMSEMVKRLGYVPHFARNGQEAVDLANEKAFEIILMDVSMPVMDGRDATMHIREGGASSDAFILGVTALIEAEDPDWYEEFGMDSVLVKPVSQYDLTKTLAEIEDGILETAEPEPQSEPQSQPEIVADFVDASAPQAEAGTDNFDFTQLCGLVGEDTAPRLVAATLNDVRTALLALRVRDNETAVLAHRAAGSTAVVGWSGLSSNLRKIEDAAHAGRGGELTDLEPQLEQLLMHAEQQTQTANVPSVH